METHGAVSYFLKSNIKIDIPISYLYFDCFDTIDIGQGAGPSVEIR